MAKVNAEKFEAQIKERITKRFEFWSRENELQMAELKANYRKDFTKEESQDHALTTIILESSIATLKRAIDEVNRIKL